MTTYLGKSCSFCLPRVPFVNCRQFMYLVISLLVLRAGYGIWLYQFLIIAYLFTLVHHSFLIKCWDLEIDRNRRHSFAGRHFELLKTKVNERHLARFCIASLCSGRILPAGPSNYRKPPQTTPNHRKPPQTTANHILYIIIIKIGLGVGRIRVRKPPQTTFYIL